MPTYSIDYGGAQDGWASAASALANALTPDYETQAKGRVMASQAHQNYAGAYANEQLGRERGAAAAAQERINRNVADMDRVLLEGGITDPEERMALISERLPTIMSPDALGANFGDIVLAQGGIAGLGPERMTDLSVGAGNAYSGTPLGFEADQRRQGQQFIMGEAGDTARAREALEFGRDYGTEEVVRDGQPAFAYRKDVLPTDRPILSETEAAALPGAGGAAPGFSYSGTGMEAQDTNLMLTVADQMRQGQTPDPRMQLAYNMAYSRLSAPKVEIRKGDDGRDYTVTTPAPDLSGLPKPFTLGQSAVVPVAPTSPLVPGGMGRNPLSFGAGTPRAQNPMFPAPGGAPAPAPSMVNDPRASVAVPVQGMPPAKPKPPTEAQARYGQYAKRIGGGARRLTSILGYDIDSGTFRPDAWKPGMYGEAVRQYVPDWMQGLALGGQEELFSTAVAQTLNPLIRADSGAAVPEGEYPRYYQQYIPMVGEEEATAKAKMDHLVTTLLAFEEVSALPEFTAAGAAGDFATQQAILHAARDRIVAETGLDVEAAIYGPGTGTETAVPPPAVAAPSTGGPDVLELPGGLVARKVNKQ